MKSLASESVNLNLEWLSCFSLLAQPEFQLWKGFDSGIKLVMCGTKCILNNDIFNKYFLHSDVFWLRLN